MTAPELIKEHDPRVGRFGWAPGDYLNKCGDCQCRFMGDKHAWQCADCAYAAPDQAMTAPEQPTPGARRLVDLFFSATDGLILPDEAVRDSLAAEVDRYANDRAAQRAPHMQDWAAECRREGRRIYNREKARRSLIECENEAFAAAAQAHPDEARAYLKRLLSAVAPQCEPLPDLIGLCTQIDSAIVWVKEQAASQARREAIEECAHFVESGIFLSDSSPAYQFAHECAAAIRRALATPQEPQS